MQKMVADKVNGTLDSSLKESWRSLIKVFKELDIEDVHNFYGRPFPSTLASINLKAVGYKQFDIQTSINVVLSLLTNYYTIFFELHMTKKPNSYVGTLTIYGNENSNAEETQLFDRVQQIVEKYFPTYSFLNHHFLMTNKVESVRPYGLTYEEYLSDKKPCSFYELLFDGRFPDMKHTERILL